MKKCLAVLLTVVLGFSLVACGGNSETTTKESSKSGGDSSAAASGAKVEGAGKKDWKIAVVPKDSTNAWFVRMETGVKRYAEETGINAFQKGPSKTDAAQQVQVIQDLISQDIDALCVVPVDPAAVEPVLQEAQEKGIIVITHEGSSVENSSFDLEAFSNAQYGAFIMDNLASAMGKEGVYTTMVAHVTNASHNEWADGAVARAQETYPKLTLLEAEPRVESEDNSEVAYNKTKELVKKYPDLKGIVGTSSKDAPGIARAIEEMGLKGKLFVSGTGMPNECRQFIKDGTLAYITLWDPADAGYAMCSLATKLLEGETVGEGTDLGLKGYDKLTLDPSNPKVLVGSGWIVIDSKTIDNYDF